MARLIPLWYYIFVINLNLKNCIADIKDNNYITTELTWSGSLDQNRKGTYTHLRYYYYLMKFICDIII